MDWSELTNALLHRGYFLEVVQLFYHYMPLADHSCTYVDEITLTRPGSIIELFCMDMGKAKLLYLF